MELKTTFFLILTFIFSISFSKAQKVDPGFMDGVIYLKIKDSMDVRLDSPQTPMPDWDILKKLYKVSGVNRPFGSTIIRLGKIFRVQFDSPVAIDSFISELQALEYIEFAEKLPILETTYSPDDYNKGLYHLNLIQAQKAWDITRGSGKVTVAIVDNAVLTTHEDLAGNMWTNTGEIPGNGLDDDLNGYVDDIHGYDVADQDGNPNPPSKTTEKSSFVHGTHCAGIASARTDNGKGIASIGFNVQIMAVKCSPDTSDGRALYSPYEGVFYAIKNGADVISMSFGGPSMTATAQNLFSTAENLDIVMVAAAGNENKNEKFYPAAYPEVISVGATDINDYKALFSNYGSWVDVVAPGVGIYSTIAGTDASYGYSSGTSMSTPMVAGLAALIKSEFPQLSAEDIKEKILYGADPVDDKNPGYESQLGTGRINAYNALSGSVLLPERKDVPIIISNNSILLPGNLEISSYSLYSVSGKELFTRKVAGENILRIPEQTPGLYILKLEIGNNSLMKKVMLN